MRAQAFLCEGKFSAGCFEINSKHILGGIWSAAVIRSSWGQPEPAYPLLSFWFLTVLLGVTVTKGFSTTMVSTKTEQKCLYCVELLGYISIASYLDGCSSRPRRWLRVRWHCV